MLIGSISCIGSIAAVMNHTLLVAISNSPLTKFVALNRTNGIVLANFTLDGFASATCEDPLFGERLIPPPEGFPSAGDFGLVFCGEDFALVSIDAGNVTLHRQGVKLCPSPAWDNMGYQLCSIIRSEDFVPTVSLKYSAFALGESVWPNHPQFWSFVVRSVVVDITVMTPPLAVVFMASRGLHTVVVLQNVTSGVYSSYGATIGKAAADWTRTLLPTRAGSVVVGRQTAVSLYTACVTFSTGPQTTNVQCVDMPSGNLLSVHEIPAFYKEVVVCPSSIAQTVLVVAGATAKLFTFSGVTQWSRTLDPAVTNVSRGVALTFTAALSLTSTLISVPLCNATTVATQCTLPNAAGSSSSDSSSSGSGNIAASNMAATVGAGIGILFLIGFNRYLEWKYPNARRMADQHNHNGLKSLH